MPEQIEINGKTYSVRLTNSETSTDEKWLELTSDDEVLKLSPNTTPEELQAYANSSEKGHDLNG